MRLTRRDFLAVTAASAVQRPAPPYSVVFRNARVVDGSGAPAFAAEVAVRGGTIVEVGRVRGRAGREVDAGGRVLAPGFIDMHNHSDETLFVDGGARSMVRQGVTTVVLGESGSAGPVQGKARVPQGLARFMGATSWSLADYFRAFARRGAAVNIASYVGIGQVWECAVGYEMRRATAAEMAHMKKLVAQAMQDGAMGLSTSLITPPSSAASRDEIVALAQVVAEHGGIYCSHIRSEGTEVFAALDEAFDVARTAGIPVEVLHLKIAERTLWGRMSEVIAKFEKARAGGVRASANVYPYTAGQNNLSAIVPPWAHDGGREMMLERLRDPSARTRMKREIQEGLPNWYNHYTATGGWEGMLLVSLKNQRDRPFQGKRMSELIAARNGDPFDVLFDVLLEEGGSVPTVYFHHREDDMQLAMRQPWCSIGSDGLAYRVDGPLGEGKPHPRSYGTFARVLGRYVRELKLLTLEDAVRKMTSLSASKLGIADRGLIKRGLRADLVLFDPATVTDRATYENPHQYAEGFSYVMVNGQFVLEPASGGVTHTAARPGRVLRGPGAERSRPKLRPRGRQAQN